MPVPWWGRSNFPIREAADPAHYRHPGWPEQTRDVMLPDGGSLRLRPLLRSDRDAWRSLRLADQEILRRVEPTVDTTWEYAHSNRAWQGMYNYLRSAAHQGLLIPMVIELNGQFVGQLTLGNIQRGVTRECWIGYWVSSAASGRGVAKAAVALAVDFAFGRVGMHRVTATYLPSNPASGAVLLANGFREEGYLRRNLHIDGSWQDHHFVALVADDFTEPAVDRLRAKGGLR